jgi:putative redox protein
MTLQMYARRKGWPLESVETHTTYGKEHTVDCEACEEHPGSKIDTFTREIHLSGALDNAQKKRLLEIADRCPVHRTLHSPTQVHTRLQNE